MMLTLLQYAGSGLGILSLLVITFIPKRIALGMVMSSISCVLVGAYALTTSQYGIFIAQSSYVFLYSVAAYNWFKIRIHKP